MKIEGLCSIPANAKETGEQAGDFKNYPIKCSLKLLAALVAISLCRQTSAATFIIGDGDVAALIMAINTANANGEDDTIELATNGTYTLIAVDNSDIGPNGLPVIRFDAGHTLVIHGNGATLQRSTAGGTPAFRIFQMGPSADVTISSLTITNGNATKNFGGGGILIYGGGGATVTITNSALSGNSAGHGGGGIFMTDGMLTLSECTLSGNSAEFGGGISGSGGGALGSTSTVTVSNCNISGNSATVNGGGIFGSAFNIGQFGASIVTVSNSTINGNSALDGGGVYSVGHNFGEFARVSVNNSTISGNSATGSGGGIYNSSQQGDGLDLGGTILNAGGSGENIFNDAGTVTSHGYNLSSDNGGGYLIGPGDQINTDPMLGPLQDNGGPTLTHALLPGSPAIDTGDPKFTPPPTYDQRGNPFVRVFNGRLDIGSFEVQPPPRRPGPTPRPRPTPLPRP